ncbi:hypothetical protein [Arthrobacter sp. PM3]|uniref:hypothetical protein n=1 Tax=Arthrobacter sp. PM3 TaxID=2017685 RepID=UPI001ABF670E|nr:hypothetical protein [Arthrobacter sp. PM3]
MAQSNLHRHATDTEAARAQGWIETSRHPDRLKGRRHPTRAGAGDLRQWPHFPTTKWLLSYHRRNAVESVNAEIKTHRGDIKRGYTHVFGLSKHTILMAFGFAATNIHILRDWHFNRHEQDPWSTQLKNRGISGSSPRKPGPFEENGSET